MTGGSLGAVSVNRAVAAQARAVLATGAEVLHLTGAGKAEAGQDAAAEPLAEWEQELLAGATTGAAEGAPAAETTTDAS